MIPVYLAASALGVALLQLILCRWRDLGPLTIGACGLAGAATIADPNLASRSVALLIMTSFVAAIAWWRGSSVGVGRSGPNGSALMAAVTMLAVPVVVPPAFTFYALTDLQIGLLGALAVIPLVSALAALDRPGARPACPDIRVRIRVEQG